MISGNNSLLCSAAQTDIVKLIVCVALTIKGTLIFEASKEKKKKGKCREKRGDEGTHKRILSQSVRRHLHTQSTSALRSIM